MAEEVTKKQCRICISEHRKDIDLLLKNRVKYSDIAREYYPYLKDSYNSEITFSRILRLHHVKKHPPLIKDLPVKAAENYRPKINITEEGEPMTIETYAQKLLELGFDPQMLTTKKVHVANILNAQKVLIEKQRNKIAEDALKISMARIMSGQFKRPEEKVLEGEAVELAKGMALPPL